MINEIFITAISIHTITKGINIQLTREALCFPSFTFPPPRAISRTLSSTALTSDTSTLCLKKKKICTCLFKKSQAGTNPMTQGQKIVGHPDARKGSFAHSTQHLPNPPQPRRSQSQNSLKNQISNFLLLDIESV